jgi:tungstate transport system substrate-binding protein
MGGLIAALCLLSATSVQAGNVLTMATTTSMDNSGLLDLLAPELARDTGIELRWTAVTTGRVLKMGERCEADVLLMHVPAAERNYVDEGLGVDRTEVLYNDFVIVGPASDPARIAGKGVVAAMKAIAGAKAPFCSQGDNSVTNKKEQSLWREAHLPIPERSRWYVETGRGMLATMDAAAERGGYAVADRRTWIRYESKHGGNPPLRILLEGGEELVDQYSVVAVNPQRCTGARYDLASTFRAWMASPATQQRIEDFKLMGKELFTANAK